MSVISNNMLAGSSGAGGDPLYVEDVFSTYLYEGNGSSTTITNGIDLSGEGGLVWSKMRNQFANHIWYDTERGGRYWLNSDNSNGAGDPGATYMTYNSNGFTVGNQYNLNASGEDIVAWAFRKAKGFFDVVTYPGDSSNGTRTISHNLGSVPGMIIVKRTDSADNWMVYHRSLGNTKGIKLDSDGGKYTASDWGNTTPTSTQFTINANDPAFNTAGGTYIAYLFAHDEQTFGTNSDEAIIKCGEYTGNSSGSNVINVGFEPQWVMMKRHDGGGQDWHIFDIGRGMADYQYIALFANKGFVESNGTGYGIEPRPNGFEITASGTDINGNNYDYIYVAIRRPHKPPETGTDVFDLKTRIGSSAPIVNTANIPIDLAVTKKRSGTATSWIWSTKLQGYESLRSDSTGAESQAAHSTNKIWAEQDAVYYKFEDDINRNGYNYFDYFFKRAAGFFDCLTYQANNNTSFNVQHSLGVAPELVIIKGRDTSFNWVVGSDGLTDWTKGIYFNERDGENTGSVYWTAAPTATELKLGPSSNVNYGTGKYMAWLFATLPGISKVGTYSGNTSQDVNVPCGFTTTPRFIMVKRVDGGGNNGDWYVWDSARGINSGNDIYSLFNSAAVEYAFDDYVDPYSNSSNSGFTISSTAPAALNASGGTYLFLAIA